MLHGKCPITGSCDYYYVCYREGRKALSSTVQQTSDVNSTSNFTFLVATLKSDKEMGKINLDNIFYLA